MGTDHDRLTAGEDDHPPAVATVRASWRRWWWLPAVVAVQKLLFWGVAANLDRARWFNNLFNWDAWFYLDIAENGYRTTTFINGRLVRTTMAFFPLYPMLGRALSWLPGMGIRPAMVTIALVSCLVAVCGIFRLGEALHSARMGAVWALVWAVVPRGFVAAMPYSESMFTALSVWAFVFLARGRWWSAAVLCALAGATRSTGISTLVGVGGAILVSLLQVLWARVRRRPPGLVGWLPGTVRFPSPWTLVGAGLLTTLGTASVLANVSALTGSWQGYFAVQREWGMAMGNPMATIHQWWLVINAPTPPKRETVKAVAYALPVWTLLMVAALVGAWRRPSWRPVVTQSLVLFALMACAQAYFNSKERYLLPGVGLLLPLAWLLAVSIERAPVGVRRWWTGVLALAWLGAAVASAVFGGTIVTWSVISP